VLQEMFGLVLLMVLYGKIQVEMARL